MGRRRAASPFGVIIVGVVTWLVMACGGSAEERSRLADASPEPSQSAPTVATAEPSPMPSPVSSPAPSAAPTASPTADRSPMRIEYGADPAQYGWLRLPPDTPDPTALRPIVVLVHGGFWAEPWDYTLMTPMAERLADRGIATWNIEFRRVNGRGGWPGTFDDVRSAIDHLGSVADDTRLDLDRVVVAGHSSGGHLALWSAGAEGVGEGSVRPARAVGIAAVTDLAVFPASVALLGGPPAEVPERWSFAQPSLDPARVELVHGAEDDIVPLFTIGNAEEAGVVVTVLDGADHFDVIEDGPALDQVVDVIVAAVDAVDGAGAD